MEEYLLVDGYNIINAWPFLKKVMDQNFEHARDRLIQDLANYRGITGKKIILVFDAHHVPGGLGHKEQVHGVEVIFTRADQTADALIERLLGELPQKALKEVATSDWAEQRLALSKGAIRISAPELLGLVRDAQLEINKYQKSQAGSSLLLESRLPEENRRVLENLRRQGNEREK